MARETAASRRVIATLAGTLKPAFEVFPELKEEVEKTGYAALWMPSGTGTPPEPPRWWFIPDAYVDACLEAETLRPYLDETYSKGSVPPYL